MNYLTEPLDKKQKKHDVSNFDCGTPVLNTWLKTQAGQAARKGYSITYVITDDANIVLGYYAIVVRKFYPTESLPIQFAEKFPAGTNVAILARLAVDLSQQGKGVGALLLREAMERIKGLAAETGDKLLIVDAKEGMVGFYEKYGFRPMPTDPQTLFLRIDEIPESTN